MMICKMRMSSRKSKKKRIVLSLHGKSFIPSNSVTTSIGQIWKARFTGEWDTWSSVPQSHKDIWFNDFKDKYKWDPKISYDVKRVFNIVGSKSMHGFMCKARQQPAAQVPGYMNLESWENLRRRWGMPEFVAKSERGKLARQANKRLHSGGSISNAEHTRRLETKKGRKPTASELFIETHMKKDKTFVDDTAKETWEQYNDKYSSIDSQDTESGNVSNTYPRWIEHVGGIKHGSVYGLGSEVDEYLFQSTNVQPLPNQDLLRDIIEEQKRMKTELTQKIDDLRDAHETHTLKVGEEMATMGENIGILELNIETMEEEIKIIQSATKRILASVQRKK